MTAIADGTALYRVRGDEAFLLYIGISDDFGRRWQEHARKQRWWGEMRSLSVDCWYKFRSEAEAAEEAAIKAEHPKHNTRFVLPAGHSGSRTNRSGLILYDTATLGFRFTGGTLREKPFGWGALENLQAGSGGTVPH